MGLYVKGFVDTLGKSLYSLTSCELVELHEKVVRRDEQQKMGRIGFAPMDTHKDIQLIENEFVRRFKKLDDYMEKEREYKETELEDRQEGRRRKRTL